MSILLGMATSDIQNNARLGFRLPKNPYEQLIIHSYIADFELYPTAQKGDYSELLTSILIFRMCSRTGSLRYGSISRLF